MGHRALLALLAALMTQAIRMPTAGAQELALAKPRFIAAWITPGQPDDASGAAVLQRRVSLDLTQAPLSVALREIATQAQLDLSYNKLVLPAGRRVSLHAREITAVGALTEVLLNSGLDVAVSRHGQIGRAHV